MVCEKKKYFLLLISFLIGTSLTPIKTSQSERSETTFIPNSWYSESEKQRISLFWIKNSSCGYFCRVSKNYNEDMSIIIKQMIK